MKMSKLNQLGYGLIFGTMLILNACGSKNSPAPVSESDTITTLKITFTPLGGGATQMFTWKDVDGTGGNPPVIDNIVLTNTKTYSASVQVLNESNGLSIDITTDVSTEREAHQFFFKTSSNLGSKLSFTYKDVDANLKPVGILTDATTTSTTSGTGNSLTITLRHLLNKGAAGVSTGDITNAGGETEIEVTFPVVIN